MYNHLFCRVYNAFGWNEYPRVFGEALLQWLRLNGVHAASALDLGCGTGVLCETLHDAGIDTLGVDLSQEMIAVARNRAPELDYRVADMVSFETDRAFDLVTCTGDALNHVTDLRNIRRVFQNVHHALAPGGLYVFDLLKADEVPDEPFEAPFSDSLTVRFSATRDADDHTTLVIDGYENGALKFSERIHERLYDVDVICSMLRETGFEVLQCADHLLPGSGGRGTTWFIIAKKGYDSKQRSDFL